MHKSAFLNNIDKFLNLKKDGIYLDCTFGCGGHSLKILNKLGFNGKLISFDFDFNCFKFSNNIVKNDKRFIFINDNFINIKKYINKFNLNKKIDGILFDLGISSYQLDNPLRGFSFMKDGPLDMRINQNFGFKASFWLNKAKENDIYKVIRDFGEERYARSISKKICLERNILPINNTKYLSNIVKSVVKFNKFKNHSTRTFQAIRIFINNELFNLKLALEESYKILSSKGRLVVISFHSLEDRIVKKFIINKSTNNFLSKIPLTYKQLNILNPIKMINLGKFKPSKNEILINPRIRSAILRVAEKI